MRSQYISLCLTFAALVACGPDGQAIYKPTQSDLRAGSIHYASANCASCHGIDFDGKGADAGRLKTQGLTATDFTRTPAAEATPVRYFKALTRGTEKLPDHTYHQLTDKARWSIAHFLFSLHPPLAGAARDQQTEALARDFAEARAAYAAARDRRWVLGYNLPTEREKPAELAQLTATVSLERPKAPGLRTERNPDLYDSEGGKLYGQHCAACHGLRGEGQNIRAGFLACKSSGQRLCGNFISTAALDLQGGFHRNTGWLPDFSALDDQDLGRIQAYLNQTGQR